MFGRPSLTFRTVRGERPPFCRAFAVPAVARSVKPRPWSSRASGKQGVLVAVVDREERGSLLRKADARAERRLEEGEAEAAVAAHDLSRRAHLGAEDRVDALELAEREDGRLDRERRGPGGSSVRPTSGERLAEAEARREPRERDAGRLRDERDGAGRAGVHLEDEELAPADRVLDVHEADDLQREPELRASPARISPSAARGTRRYGGRTAYESPEWMPACSMCCMTPAIDDVLAVAERVDVQLVRVLEEAVDEDRPVRERRERLAEDVAEGVLVVRRSASRARRGRSSGGRGAGSRASGPRACPRRRRARRPTAAPARSDLLRGARRSARGPRRGRWPRAASRGSARPRSRARARA